MEQSNESVQTEQTSFTDHMKNNSRLMQKSGVKVTLKTLLEAGAHYGHQVERWNPKMGPYIFTERNGVHIINLDNTMKLWERAVKYVHDRASVGGTVLFVGTKYQSREIMKEEAERCGQYYCTSRWLGGTLTNFDTVRRSVERMKKMEDLLAKSQDETTGVKLNKKERLGIMKHLEKLQANIGGIRTMKKIPDVLFVIDINKDDIAIKEARRLHIPVVALVDSNTDPTLVDFPIPSNDDAPKVLRLFTAAIADAVIDGKSLFDTRLNKHQTPANVAQEVQAAANLN